MNQKIISAIAVGILFFGVSCKDDTGIKISSEQSTAVQDASTSDAYFNDASDMSTTAVAKPENDQFSGGRTSGVVSLNLSCCRFTRRYWGNPCWFLFLRLLICLSSAGIPT